MGMTLHGLPRGSKCPGCAGLVNAPPPGVEPSYVPSQLGAGAAIAFNLLQVETLSRPKQGRSSQPIKQEIKMSFFNTTSPLAGGASQTSNWLTGEQTINGSAGSDFVTVDKASGLAGALGLYEVSVNGRTQYMTQAELEKTQFNLGGGDDVMVVADDVKANIKANGGNGDDVIVTGGGNDRVQGGAGNDIIYTGDGHDVAQGGRGDDWVHGGAGNDSVSGGRGQDQLLGGSGKNKVERDWADIFGWLTR
jgi:Ca2+-binding RTX toxin-like protein